MSAAALLIIVAGAIWLVAASSYSRQAVWFLMLWIPVQGWVQLNVFNDSSATVLLYEFQIIGIYAIFAIRAARSPQGLALPPALRLAIPFVAWALLLVPYSVSTNGVILTVLGLRTYLLPLPLLWIGYHMFTARRQLETVTWLLMLQLAPIAVVTMAQFGGLTSTSGAVFSAAPTGYVYAGGVIRPPGTFSAPGHLGMYILFAIPFALGLLGLQVPLSKRAGFVIGLAGATVALMANTQRATMVLLVVALPLIPLVARRRGAMLKTVSAVIVILGGAYIGSQVTGEAFRERVASISRDLDLTLVANPMERMADALREPWWGGGLGIASPGATRLEPEPVMGFASDISRRTPIKPAESFMAALVYQTGIAGLVFFYLFIAALMYRSLQAVRACRTTDFGLLTAALFSYQIAILLQSWAYDPLHYPPTRVFFWLWTGALLSLPRLVATAPTHERVSAGRVPAGAARRLTPAPIPSPAIARARLARTGDVRRRGLPHRPGPVTKIESER